MEEITIELDDEVAAWLESSAAEHKKSASEVVEELIRQLRASVRAAAGEDL